MILADHLRTHTPFLKPEAEWPMSKGPWEIREHHDSTEYNILGIFNGKFTHVAENVFIYDARYIAALSPDVVVPMWWECYKEYEDWCSVLNEPKESPEWTLAIRILNLLDTIGVVGWKPKEGE